MSVVHPQKKSPESRGRQIEEHPRMSSGESRQSCIFVVVRVSGRQDGNGACGNLSLRARVSQNGPRKSPIQGNPAWPSCSSLGQWSIGFVCLVCSYQSEVPLTVTGMRANDVIGNDPSPFSLMYRMSTSSTASSRTSSAALNLLSRFLPIMARRSTAARSRS